jgi:hypothetical protein
LKKERTELVPLVAELELEHPKQSSNPWSPRKMSKSWSSMQNKLMQHQHTQRPWQ